MQRQKVNFGSYSAKRERSSQKDSDGKQSVQSRLTASKLLTDSKFSLIAALGKPHLSGHIPSSQNLNINAMNSTSGPDRINGIDGINCKESENGCLSN